MIAVTAEPAAVPPLVCIDPGHSRRANLSLEPIGPGSHVLKIKDGGGTAGEARVVLQISRKLRRVLVRQGFRVAMTRTTMNFTLPEGGNIARARFCNRRHAKLMLRIHADGSTDAARHGASTLYPAWHRGWTDDIYARSVRAGKAMQRAVATATGATNRGVVQRSDLTGFNWADVPVVLIESGFLSNPTEAHRLETASYQQKVAAGLTRGVAAFVAP